MPKISAGSLEQHRAETIERLIDSYAALVMKDGYASVSLADVAAASGLARTAIYNYFPDREAMLFAWTEREVGRAIDQLHTLVAEAQSAGEKLRVFIRAQLEGFGTRHLPPGQEVMQFLRPETYKSFMSHIEPLEQLLQTIVKEGTAAKEFAAIEPDDAVPMIMACIGGERAPLASKQHSIDQATERVATFVLRALGAKTPAKKPRTR